MHSSAETDRSTGDEAWPGHEDEACGGELTPRGSMCGGGWS